MINKKKNLIILGNGFDLSLGVKSSFNKYIVNQYYKYENKIISFKHDYKDKQMKFSDYIKKIVNSYKLRINSIINRNENRVPLRHVPRISLYVSDISYYYLNIKLCIPGFMIEPSLFERTDKTDKNVTDKKLRDITKDINDFGESLVNKLKKKAKNIHVNNLWNLLMINQYLTDKEDATWCDVENMIKMYLTSIIISPKSSRDNLYQWEHIYNNVNYYFDPNEDLSSGFFNLSISINRAFFLLRQIINTKRAISHINDKDIKYDLYEVYEWNTNSQYNDLLLPNVDETNVTDEIESPLAIIFLMEVIFNYKVLPSYNSIDIRDLLFDFAKKQLNKFEADFSGYLRNRIDKHNFYRYKSLSLLNKLSSSSPKKYNVIDFNYTPVYKDINCEHIHGSLKNGNIIIGIGDIEINKLWKNMTKDKRFVTNHYYDKLFSFTKTSRLFYENRENSEHILSNIHNIIFFGHSLGVNDFPYFEALFDHFDLYNNVNIHLTFCFCKHYKNDGEDHRSKLIKRVIHLLSQYSKTMNNRNHGKNLITKMLIEHRIHILDVTKYVNSVSPLKNSNLIQLNYTNK